MATLMEKYRSEVVSKLKERLGVKNPMRVPRVQKVVINMGMGIVDQEGLKAKTRELTTLSGQKPQLRKSRKSISNFKLREGMTVGAKVTLRGRRMYEFLDRLINASLPRIRDFRGLPTRSFDREGNYTFGLKEQTIFPEIDADAVQHPQGMDITIVTTARNREEALELLKLLGMPFASSQEKGATVG